LREKADRSTRFGGKLRCSSNRSLFGGSYIVLMNWGCVIMSLRNKSRLSGLRRQSWRWRWVTDKDGLAAAGTDLLSLDAGFTRSDGEVEQILLENSQLDEMPRRHCIPRAEGIKAALYYFRNGTRAPFISWFPS